MNENKKMFDEHFLWLLYKLVQQSVQLLYKSGAGSPGLPQPAPLG